MALNKPLFYSYIYVYGRHLNYYVTLLLTSLRREENRKIAGELMIRYTTKNAVTISIIKNSK